MTDDFGIAHLADAPDALPALAQLFVETWEPYYGEDGPGDAGRDLDSCCNKNTIPLALVALDADRRVLGTAALKPESIASHPHLTPWLAALVVSPPERGGPLCAALVNAIEDEARRLGFDKLYTGIDTSSPLARRPEWAALDEASSLRGPIKIYVRDLGQS